MFERDGPITTELEYDTDSFQYKTIDRISPHFLHLLQQVVQDPDAQVSAIDLMDAEEHDLLKQWSGTSRPYPRDKSVPELFEEQALAHPRRTALLYENQPISYE